MLDFNNSKSRIEIIDQEDRALLRSNPSAWSMPEDGKEHIFYHMLLSSPVCRACSATWRCKSSTQPDGGEVLAKRKSVAVRQGSKEAWSKAVT